WQLAHSVCEVELPPPVVVKVTDRGGRTNCIVVRRLSRLSAAIDASRALTRGPALIEELVSGPEVAVTGFSAEGVVVPVAVTERVCAEVPAFGVPVAQLWPTPHAERAAEVARRAVAAVGIDEGPSVTVLRLSRGGPEVIEVAARLGGGHDAELA